MTRGAGPDPQLAAAILRPNRIASAHPCDDKLDMASQPHASCATCGKGYHDKFEQPRQLGVCDKCGGTEFKRRPDDNEATVRTRMAEYRAKTAPILPIYEARGIVSRVDGMADMDAVTAAIETVLAR